MVDNASAPVLSFVRLGAETQLYVTSADGLTPVQASHLPRGIGLLLNDTPLGNDALGRPLTDWSPDGAQIAYSGDILGMRAIYVMNADGTGQRRLTDPEEGTMDLDPSWSPDGQQIAFTTDRDGPFGIYVIRADGTDLRQLTDATASDELPDWSPDGRRIAFSSARGAPPRPCMSWRPTAVTPCS